MIRRAIEADRDWIRSTAANAYQELGDYDRIIPSWLEHSGVLTFVDEQTAPQPERRGFMLLGFYEPERPMDPYVAELLAIAVDPRFQRQGIGRRLLNHAIQVAQLAGANQRVSELRLTVADNNEIGQRLYRSEGFEVVGEDHGLYEGGQRAVRMTRCLL